MHSLLYVYIYLTIQNSVNKIGDNSSIDLILSTFGIKHIVKVEGFLVWDDGDSVANCFDDVGIR